MNCHELTLKALQAKLRLDLEQAGAAVARATTLHARLQRQSAAAAQRCESAAHELRAALGQSRINPALLLAMRRLYQQEHLAWQEAQVRCAAAGPLEQQARDTLADLRHQEQSLHRALLAERRKARLKAQAIDMTEADDRWLQHAHGTLP